MQHTVPFLVAVCLSSSCPAQLTPAVRTSIDEIVLKTLAETGAPSASIAVVEHETVYAKAYGEARLSPKTAARPDMRYKIGSNSKQIAAAAILLLVQDGKLSLDDPVARFLPSLTRARDITIRQLLSHTSGYQDCYPLDYVAPFMARETTPAQILNQWAKIPLDFEPGTRWQYSNTNYVIIGQIVEKITEKPLIDFLRASIFEPLGMHSVVDVSRERWSLDDPAGYTQFAPGPPRESAHDGNGWLYAAGELAMTASDLALWDKSLADGALLELESIKAMTSEVVLKGGSGTRYALGLKISATASGKRVWSHDGGLSGFHSQNTIYPDDKISITVLTNSETPAASTIAKKIEDLVFATLADPDAEPAPEHAKTLFKSLSNGDPDRPLISPSR